MFNRLNILKNYDEISCSLPLPVFFFQSCAPEQWKEKVLDTCVNDFQRHSYFISLQVKTDSAVVRCLVRTGYLFLYFKDHQGVNAENRIRNDMDVQLRSDYGNRIIDIQPVPVLPPGPVMNIPVHIVPLFKNPKLQ